MINHNSTFKEIVVDLETMEVKYDEEDFRVDFVMFIALLIFDF